MDFVYVSSGVDGYVLGYGNGIDWEQQAISEDSAAEFDSNSGLGKNLMHEDVLKLSYALDASLVYNYNCQELFFCGTLMQSTKLLLFMQQAGVTSSLVETSQVMRDTDLSPGQPLQSNPPSGSLGVIGRKGVSDLGAIGDSITASTANPEGFHDQLYNLQMLETAYYKLPLKQDLFAKEMGDNLDVNLKQGSDGIDTKTMAQDNSERETISEVEDPKFSMEGCKNMENQLDLISEIQENDGYDMCISEADNALDYGVESKSEADNTVDDGLENKDVEISCDTKSENATKKETENAEDMDFEVSPDVLVDGNSCDFNSEKESENKLKDENYMDSEFFSQSSSGEAKAELNVLDLETPAADIVGEGSAIDLVKDVEMGLAPNNSEADFELIDNGEEFNSTEILQHKQREQGADQVSIASEESLGEGSSDEVEANFGLLQL